MFIGTLTKLEEIKDSQYSEIYAHFSVKKIYKGSVNQVEVVRFNTGDCGVKISEVGMDYFVYKDLYKGFPAVANMTGKVVDAKMHIEYAESLSKKHPIYTISGYISGLTLDELKKVVINIQGGSTRYKVSVDKNGFFKFVAKKDATYNVKISLPFDALIWTKVLMKNFKEEFRSEGHSIDYSIQFRPNECDDRDIQVSKVS